MYKLLDDLNIHLSIYLSISKHISRFLKLEGNSLRRLMDKVAETYKTRKEKFILCPELIYL